MISLSLVDEEYGGAPASSPVTRRRVPNTIIVCMIFITSVNFNFCMRRNRTGVVKLREIGHVKEKQRLRLRVKIVNELEIFSGDNGFMSGRWVRNSEEEQRFCLIPHNLTFPHSPLRSLFLRSPAGDRGTQNGVEKLRCV
ncbi:hypothetical protein GmHk_04G009311 [Glycine max]|nr:hypothetical protein GmHk_04G009311 [Glycine max]